MNRQEDCFWRLLECNSLLPDCEALAVESRLLFFCPLLNVDVGIIRLRGVYRFFPQKGNTYAPLPNDTKARELPFETPRKKDSESECVVGVVVVGRQHLHDILYNFYWNHCGATTRIKLLI